MSTIRKKQGKELNNSSNNLPDAYGMMMALICDTKSNTIDYFNSEQSEGNEFINDIKSLDELIEHLLLYGIDFNSLPE